MKSNPDSKESGQDYIYGPDSSFTQKWFSARTAEKQAGWFLPYLKPGMTLLDCGCASGSITVGLAKVVEPGQVTGIDISESDIKRAQERAGDAKISNIHFEEGNVYDLNFSDGSFDALFSHNVLEHIPEPSKALKEMHRVLKPGGIIGIRDIDMGGVLFAPEAKQLEKYQAIHEVVFRNAGGNPRIGRVLGRLLYEAAFTDVKMSASYDYWGDSENRDFAAQTVANRLADADFTDQITKAKAAEVEDIESIKNYMFEWQELQGAFWATSHCEVIGWKAR